MRKNSRRAHLKSSISIEKLVKIIFRGIFQHRHMRQEARKQRVGAQ